MKLTKILNGSFAALFCSSGLAHGAFLAITEGPSNANNAYGTDVWANFPNAYTSGQYTLSWFQNVQPTVDTIQRSYISMGPMPTDFRTGSDENTDGITGLIGGVSFDRNVWQQHVLSIDLDANTYSHEFNGLVVSAAGTVWDDNAGDAFPPALEGMNFWMGNSGAGANLDGVDGSVFLDDFLLTDGGGTELWSEDFENGLGSFNDFGGAIVPQVVPEPSTAILGLLGLLGFVGRRSR